MSFYGGKRGIFFLASLFFLFLYFETTYMLGIFFGVFLCFFLFFWKRPASIFPSHEVSGAIFSPVEGRVVGIKEVLDEGEKKKTEIIFKMSLLSDKGIYFPCGASFVRKSYTLHSFWTYFLKSFFFLFSWKRFLKGRHLKKFSQEFLYGTLLFI